MFSRVSSVASNLVLKRAGWVVLAAAISVATAACGGPAFDKAFNQAFDKSTHDSCVPAAEAHGATPDLAEKYCTCVVGQLSSLTVQEKQNLNNTPEKLTAAASVCKAQLQ
jgi:hypothetical protein